MNYNYIEKWINEIMQQSIPDDVEALNFNLYEDGNYNWSIELVGTERFDLEDEDWRCDEIFDFGTRDTPLAWKEEKTWEEILNETIQILNRYLEQGQYAGVMKRYQGVGVGFVDGDANILFAQ